MNSKLDCTVTETEQRHRKIEGNVFEIFSSFYSSDLTRIREWLALLMKHKTSKNDTMSGKFRRVGNEYFVKKDLANSLLYYTKSVCYAITNSKEYGLALANRSAVAFELREYENCLKDIELCFKAKYPVDLKPKIYLRKTECLAELNHIPALNNCISEFLKFLKQTTGILDKDKYIKRLAYIKNDQNRSKPKKIFDNSFENIYELPLFTDGENENFAFASSKLKLSYDADRGRHVVAKNDIKCGDTLFIEKAYVFAPVYRESRELSYAKCYYCLKDIINSLPCLYCTFCAYCDDKCRDSSWIMGHRWECLGMQANIWYHIGIAFPALKVVLKAASTGFITCDSDFVEDIKCYGNKDNNYNYIYRLVSNISKSCNIMPYVITATIITAYLESYTNFFGWLLTQPHCPKATKDECLQYIGGLITKHIAQLSCNSSTIEHWTSSSSDLFFPDILLTVACGIFPSVSMMNHSCKPNITNYFICDTIIVKALEDIKEGEEIFNCYGLDFRAMDKENRQDACQQTYYFDCNCIICSDSKNEMVNVHLLLNSYKCPHCGGSIIENEELFSYCNECHHRFELEPFRKINREAQRYLDYSEIYEVCKKNHFLNTVLEDQRNNQIELLKKSLTIREKILSKNHKDFEEVYYKIYNYFVENCDAENMFNYFHLWLDNEKVRLGNNSRGVGTKLYEAAIAISHCLLNGQPKSSNRLKIFLEKLNRMIIEAKQILNLYYPDYITNRLNRKLKFFANK